MTVLKALFLRPVVETRYIRRLMDIANLKVEAEAGSVVAQSILGLLYFYGSVDVPKDYSEAVQWLTLAAQHGTSRPLHHLGLMYERGLGVEVDLERAFGLQKRAAERGEEAAYIHVARMYRHGQGTAADGEAACEWYKRVLVLGAMPYRNSGIDLAN